MEAFSCTEKQHPHADLVTDASFELQVATQAFWQSFGDLFPHTSDHTSHPHLTLLNIAFLDRFQTRSSQLFHLAQAYIA